MKHDLYSLPNNTTIEIAVKVNSVPDEYDYLREFGLPITLKKQRLFEKNGKSYDVMEVKDHITDEEYEFFFDVSSFHKN